MAPDRSGGYNRRRIWSTGGRFPRGRTASSSSTASQAEVRLLRHLDGARLADHDHLHLAGVLELILDLSRYLVRQQCGALVVHLGGLDDDADLAPRLEGVRLGDTRLRHG